MTAAAELDDATHLRIEMLSQEGNVLLDDDGDWQGALAKWQAALDLVPQPQTDWEAALWLHASMGDAYLAGGQPGPARDQFDTAYRCPDGHVNPYVLLQLGKIFCDAGDHDAAVKMLLRAYMLEGDALFVQDARYLGFLKQHVDLTAR